MAFVPSFMKISLPLRSFLSFSAGASLPFVVLSRSSRPSHSSYPSLFLPFPLFLLFLLVPLFGPNLWLCAKNQGRAKESAGGLRPLPQLQSLPHTKMKCDVDTCISRWFSSCLLPRSCWQAQRWCCCSCFTCFSCKALE